MNFFVNRNPLSKLFSTSAQHQKKFRNTSNLPRNDYLFSLPSSSPVFTCSFMTGERGCSIYTLLASFSLLLLFIHSSSSYRSLPLHRSLKALSFFFFFYLPDSSLSARSDTSFFRFPQISSSSDKPIDQAQVRECGTFLPTHSSLHPSPVLPPLLLCATRCEHYSPVFLCSPFFPRFLHRISSVHDRRPFQSTVLLLLPLSIDNVHRGGRRSRRRRGGEGTVVLGYGSRWHRARIQIASFDVQVEVPSDVPEVVEAVAAEADEEVSQEAPEEA